MIVIRKKIMIRIILVVLFLAGFFTAYLVRRSQVRIGEHYLWLNPFAQINPKKQYTLRVWDYDLPIGSGDQSYNQYFKKMLADFEKEYPNIRVELTLIDLIDGEKKLQQALSRNKAPDVYCSFSSVPEFYHRRQIPVGPFLNRKIRMMYLRPVSDLYGAGKGLCPFPRWISTDIWVGNRRLLKSTGLDIPKIQNEGWEWDDLLQLHSYISKKTKLLTGTPINRGYATYLKQLVPSKRKRAVTNIISLQKIIQAEPKTQYSERDSLAQFSQGHSLLLAGVRPTIYLFLKEASAQGKFPGVDPVILPAPRLIPGVEVQFIESGIINVYRNYYTAGDDHLMAALRLGQFISTYPNETPWARLGVFPAGVQIKLATELDGLYYQMLRRSILRRQSDPGKNKELVDRFLNGRITAEEFQKSMVVKK